MSPSSIVAALKAPPAPAPAPTAAPAPGGGSSPFAKLLSAQQPGKGGDVANQMDGPARPATSGESASATESTAEPRDAGKAAAGRRAIGRGPGRAGAAPEAKAAQIAPGPDGDLPATAGSSTAAADREPTEPSLQDGSATAGLVAAITLAPALPAPGGAAPGLPDAALALETASLSPAPPALLTVGADAAHDAASVRSAATRTDAARDRFAEDAAASAVPSATADVAQAHADKAGLIATDFKDVKERLDARTEPQATALTPSTTPMAALQAGVRPDAALPPASGASLAMPTPVDSPQFREALGVQVSVLARDGVQQAQLQLNPADMGPISVQIALDGTRAQVDFGADSSATRQIIESGLPELAAALREAGFTLAGGGVSQHSRGRAEGEAVQSRAGSAERGGDTGGDPATAGRINVRLPLGAVDLYA